jgi:hypothetical protein
MLKKNVWVVVLAMALIVAVGGSSTWAQGPGTSKAGDAEEKVPGAYRLDFIMSELEDGKKINTRQYSMNLKSPDANEIKIGTRVPVEVKQGEFQYLDVGTNIWCKLREQDTGSANNVMLNVKAELSNFSIPDQQSQSMRPAIRQMKIEASTIAVIGKPMVIGSADDPNSKRQFQLEVTVTKLR